MNLFDLFDDGFVFDFETECPECGGLGWVDTRYPDDPAHECFLCEGNKVVGLDEWSLYFYIDSIYQERQQKEVEPLCDCGHPERFCTMRQTDVDWFVCDSIEEYDYEEEIHVHLARARR